MSYGYAEKFKEAHRLLGEALSEAHMVGFREGGDNLIKLVNLFLDDPGTLEIPDKTSVEWKLLDRLSKLYK